MRYISRASFGVNIGFLFLACVFIHRKGGLDWLMYQFSGGQAVAYSHTKQSVYDCIPITSNDIVMLGDSMLDYGEWHELLGNPRAKSRAIAGDCVHDVIARLGPIVEARPAHIVVMVGANDLQRGEPVEQVATEYRHMVDIICTMSPDTVVWLLPVLAPHERLYRQHIKPRYPGIHMPTVDQVKDLNTEIRGLASHNVYFIGLDGLLEEGQIAAAYTLDGLHLSGRGLIVVAGQLLIYSKNFEVQWRILCVWRESW